MMPSKNNKDTTSISIEITTISYQNLEISSSNNKKNKNKDLKEISQKLQKSFQNYGIVFISNIPKFTSLKQSLLPQTYNLARCTTKEYLENELTDVKSLYNAGWSHGKEKLNDTGSPDLSKGSFYYNPITDIPGSQKDREEYPCSYPCNIWPGIKDNDSDHHSIPESFECLCKEMGRLMHHVTVLVSRHIDNYMMDNNVNVKDKYSDDLLYNSLKDTEKVKCRLLYYYPITTNNDNGHEDKEDSWIGWHNDSGFLTALAGDIYVDDETGAVLPNGHPDPDTGLYISDCNGTIHNIQIPKDCMAIQIGECTQIITGGMVRATPHCVKAGRDQSIARISLACFVDTKADFRLCIPKWCRIDDVISCPLKDKVPPLDKRWNDGITFGEFLDNTFRKFYDW